MSRAEPRVGAQIQRLRRRRNLSQVQLAQDLGISASYLNLIEHNRRHITVTLLLKLSRYFEIDAGELADSDRSQLAGQLMEVFGDELFSDLELTNHDIHDFAASSSKVGQAVARLFDQYRAARKQSQPMDAIAPDPHSGTVERISDLLQAHLNHFPLLEAAAERIRGDIDLASDSFENGLRTYLYNALGLRWRVESLAMDKKQLFNAERDELTTSDMLPPESAIFAAARQLGHLVLEPEMAELLEAASLPPEAVPTARDAFASYFAAALIMPYAPFHQACKEMRYDVERIGRRFKTSFEQVCHRMTTMQRPGLAGVPLHLIRTDIAGNISKRFSMSGIYIPRHSGACPRWNVYSAFLHPEEINVQLSQMPGGERYLCIAKSLTKGGYRHNAPRRHLSIGLGCHIAHASALIYSDGFDIANTDKTVPIGVGCRSCPRPDCEQRAHPAVQLACS
jgi:predicted transcriptional regulator/DNA-binding XRE family transcriptional regulator